MKLSLNDFSLGGALTFVLALVAYDFVKKMTTKVA
jgi:hypothetical protein